MVNTTSYDNVLAEYQNAMREYQAMVNAGQQHVAVAHAKILAQKTEIRLLNAVIFRRKRGMRRMRAYIDAVKRVHRAVLGDDRLWYCRECKTIHPCNTLDALQTVRDRLIEETKHDGD